MNFQLKYLLLFMDPVNMVQRVLFFIEVCKPDPSQDPQQAPKLTEYDVFSSILDKTLGDAFDVFLVYIPAPLHGSCKYGLNGADFSRSRQTRPLQRPTTRAQTCSIWRI